MGRQLIIKRTAHSDAATSAPRRGTYAAALPAELDRIFRITDGVMRSLIVCKDK